MAFPESSRRRSLLMTARNATSSGTDFKMHQKLAFHDDEFPWIVVVCLLTADAASSQSKKRRRDECAWNGQIQFVVAQMGENFYTLAHRQQKERKKQQQQLKFLFLLPFYFRR